MRTILAILLLWIAVGPVSHGQLADGYLETWITRRAAQLTHRFSRRPLDEIGWADSIQQAVQLAKQHERPVLLFTLDGHMNSGRC